MTPGSDADRARLARATVMVVASAACFSTIAIFVTLALRAGAPLLTVLTGRFVFGALALAPIVGWAALGGTPRPQRRALVFRAGFLQAALVFCSGASLRWLNAATLVFLFYSYPAWVTLISMAQRKERVTLRRAVALGMSLAGVTIMVGAPGAGSVHPAGVAFALTSALLFAIYIVYMDRLQASSVPAVTSFWVCVGAGTVFLTSAALTSQLTLAVAPRVWLYMLGLGALSTAIGFALFFKGLQRLGAVRTAIISTVEPFWAALFGWLILAQPVTSATVLGGLLIALAVMTLQWPSRSAARSQPAVS